MLNELTRVESNREVSMNVLILTQPLLNNYGGVLQNYALQIALKKLGCCTRTIDWIPSSKPFYIYACSWLKTILLRLIGKKRPFERVPKPYCRNKKFDEFVVDFIALEKCNGNIAVNLNWKPDVIVVGSDQVWRPIYNYRIKDMFLDFCKKERNLKRIAYAASFGVDNWEYPPRQTRICSELAKKFDAISVREESGVKLCKEHLGVDATWVLDPTLLLTKEDYLPLCEEVPVCFENYLAVYALDENKEVAATYEKEATKRGLIVKKFHADSKSTLTVPEWLAMFRDASYVVTDSFHGTVFSIIFGKEFKCVYNKDRGAARFESLLDLYNSGKFEEMREFSLNWLKNALVSSLDKAQINDFIK